VPEAQPLADITNKDMSDQAGKKTQARPQRDRKERGPPADGIPSKTKVMVANLPYELTEDKVRICRTQLAENTHTNKTYSSRTSLMLTSPFRPRLPSAQSLDS